MDEDIVAILAIFVVMFAAYSGLPLLDPLSIRRRSTGRPMPQPSTAPRPPPKHVAETFAQKAAQRRATRITR